VREENIVATDKGARLLTRRATAIDADYSIADDTASQCRQTDQDINVLFQAKQIDMR
jgi:hypothetical protein